MTDLHRLGLLSQYLRLRDLPGYAADVDAARAEIERLTCRHDLSSDGDEGPVVNLPGNLVVRWRCNECGGRWYDDENLALLRDLIRSQTDALNAAEAEAERLRALCDDDLRRHGVGREVVAALTEEAVRLRDAVDRVTALTYASDDGSEFEHVPGCEGEDTCPACWAASIWQALDGIAALTDALGEGDRAAELDRWVADTQARHRDALTLLAYEEQIEREATDDD